MSAVLGVSGLFHDAAAALFVDGVLVAAVQEERFSRHKNDPSLPWRAMAWCLEQMSLCAAQLDAVVFYEDGIQRALRAVTEPLRHFPHAWRSFPHALRAELGSKVWARDQLSERLGVPRAKVHMGQHHLSHAAHAFFSSPYDSADVLTIDGVGERNTAVAYAASGCDLREVCHWKYPHSLGLFYAAVTSYLGFHPNDGEYKVMGLAAYGARRFEREFEEIVQLHDDGNFSLDLRFFDHVGDSSQGFSREFARKFGPPRTPGRAWDLSTEQDQRYAAIARGAQDRLEQVMVHMARAIRARSSASNLCFGGGVALNAVANARLLRDAGYSRVFVPAGAGDAGGAIGAAAAHLASEGIQPRIESPFLGPYIDAGRAADIARAMGMRVTTVSDPCAAMLDMLDVHPIIARAAGRTEFGARALGARSLLARADNIGIRETLNRAIKERENFRPFAPIVRSEDAARFFDDAPNDMTPQMTTVCTVHEHARAALPAVTHVDGTARVQTVASTDFHLLLSSMARRTDTPVLLNTSMNGRHEPICSSAEDVIGFMASHRVHAAFVEDLLITKELA